MSRSLQPTISPSHPLSMRLFPHPSTHPLSQYPAAGCSGTITTPALFTPYQAPLSSSSKQHHSLFNYIQPVPKGDQPSSLHPAPSLPAPSLPAPSLPASSLPAQPKDRGLRDPTRSSRKHRAHSARREKHYRHAADERRYCAVTRENKENIIPSSLGPEATSSQTRTSSIRGAGALACTEFQRVPQSRAVVRQPRGDAAPWRPVQTCQGKRLSPIEEDLMPATLPALPPKPAQAEQPRWKRRTDDGMICTGLSTRGGLINGRDLDLSDAARDETVAVSTPCEFCSELSAARLPLSAKHSGCMLAALQLDRFRLLLLQRHGPAYNLGPRLGLRCGQMDAQRCGSGQEQSALCTNNSHCARHACQRGAQTHGAQRVVQLTQPSVDTGAGRGVGGAVVGGASRNNETSIWSPSSNSLGGNLRGAGSLPRPPTQGKESTLVPREEGASGRGVESNSVSPSNLSERYLCIVAPNSLEGASGEDYLDALGDSLGGASCSAGFAHLSCITGAMGSFHEQASSGELSGAFHSTFCYPLHSTMNCSAARGYLCDPLSGSADSGEDRQLYGLAEVESNCEESMDWSDDVLSNRPNQKSPSVVSKSIRSDGPHTIPEQILYSAGKMLVSDSLRFLGRTINFGDTSRVSDVTQSQRPGLATYCITSHNDVTNNSALRNCNVTSDDVIVTRQRMRRQMALSDLETTTKVSEPHVDSPCEERPLGAATDGSAHSLYHQLDSSDYTVKTSLDPASLVVSDRPHQSDEHTVCEVLANHSSDLGVDRDQSVISSSPSSRSSRVVEQPDCPLAQVLIKQSDSATSIKSVADENIADLLFSPARIPVNVVSSDNTPCTAVLKAKKERTFEEIWASGVFQESTLDCSDTGSEVGSGCTCFVRVSGAPRIKSRTISRGRKRAIVEKLKRFARCVRQGRVTRELEQERRGEQELEEEELRKRDKHEQQGAQQKRFRSKLEQLGDI